MTDYYVDRASTGSGDGTTQATTGPNAAWRDLSEVVALVAGDNVYFNRGDTWAIGSERAFTYAGTAESRITLDAYGSGAMPIITRKAVVVDFDVEETWTEDGTNLWKTTYACGWTRCFLTIGATTTEALAAQDETKLTAKYNFTFTGSYPNNVLWLYCESNPALVYDNIEVSQLGGSIATLKFTTNCEYMTMKNLDVQAGAPAILMNSTCVGNIIVEDCTIGKYSRGGILVQGGDDCIVRNCTFDPEYLGDKDFAYSAAVRTYVGIFAQGGDSSGWEVHHCTFKNYNATGVNLYGNSTNTVEDWLVHHNEISAPDLSYAHGIQTDQAAAGMCTNNKFYNNYIHDIYTKNQINGTGNWVYNNIFKDMVRTNCAHSYDDTGEYAKSSGIDMSGYAGDCVNNKIFNNVFINIAEEAIRMGATSGNPVEGNEFINNICFNCGYDSFEGSIPYSFVMMNYADNNTNTVKNNCFYQHGVTDVAYYRGVVMNIDEFNAGEAESDVISGNIAVNPRFYRGTGEDYRLTSSSPCKNAGIDMSRTVDYLGNPIVGLSDIGAFESQVLDILLAGKFGVSSVVDRFGGDGLNKYGADKISNRFVQGV